MVVLGLDGLPLDLALKLGHFLPNIQRIAARAITVQSEIPELSPVNWTSFFTAQGPEQHGIFGFSRIDPVSYQLEVANSTHISCPTLFDHMGKAGLVSRVINLPTTYPVRPLRGMLISGFVSHDLQHAAYPPFLSSKLIEMGYKLEADTSRRNSDPDYLLSELRYTLQSRLSALDILWPDLSWDLFVHVFTETDRLFHFHIDAVVDPAHPQHMACMQFLADWDQALGAVLDRYDALSGPKRLMILADHGFTMIKTEFCLNTWLKQQGLLTLSGTPSNEWDASTIAPESSAFALDPGRIYIHTDRFGRGSILQGEADKIKDKITTQLMNLTWNGERVMEQVYTGAALYPGAPSDQVPDLVCQARPGFDLKAKFNRDDVFGLHGRTGTHTVEGAIFLDSQGGTPQRMRDTGQIILDYFNIPTS